MRPRRFDGRLLWSLGFDPKPAAVRTPPPPPPPPRKSRESFPCREPGVAGGGRFADRLEIVGDGSPQGTRVLFDGVLLNGVRSVSWTAEASGRAGVTLELAGQPTIKVDPSC